MVLIGLSIVDTEWPAILAAGVLGILFVLIRAYRHKRDK